MSVTTNFGSAIKSGTGLGVGEDAGFVVLAKSVAIQASGAASQAFTMEFPPAGVKLLNIFNSTSVAHTAATITVAVGTAAAGDQLVTATDIKALGRDVLNTDAKMAAFAGFTGGTLHLTVAAGTPTTTGTSEVVVMYMYEG